jgi:hypothetical protein
VITNCVSDPTTFLFVPASISFAFSQVRQLGSWQQQRKPTQSEQGGTGKRLTYGVKNGQIEDKGEGKFTEGASRYVKIILLTGRPLLRSTSYGLEDWGYGTL